MIALAVVAVLLLLGTSVIAAPYGSRTMKSGAVGVDVAELQRRLNDLGYPSGHPDGIFGGKTQQALIRFQRAYGLVPDGLAGKWTLQAVDRAYTWKNGFTHRVVAGDSLWIISQRYGTTVDALVWLNRMPDHMLYPGQDVRVPGDAKHRPSGPQATVVQPATPTIPAPALPTNPILPSPSVGLGTSLGGVAPSASVPYTVLGYYAEDWKGDLRALDSLKSAAGKVHLLVNFQLFVDRDGTITTDSYPAMMAEARRQGIPVQGLLHNMTNGRFDKEIARAVLSSPAVRARTISNLVKTANQYGLSGINVDIEDVPPNQRDNYSAFVRELSIALRPHSLGLTLSIPAKTFDDRTSSWSGAFDYRELGKHADYIVPMAYDEHLPGWSAGPIASVGWVDKVAAFAASQIPREKVLLGMAAYAYDWKVGTTEGRGMSAPQAVKLAQTNGATLNWDHVAQVPFFTYERDGHARIVYYENARSMALKLDLVRKHNLGGIGIWRLGLEDAAIWSAIDSRLK